MRCYCLIEVFMKLLSNKAYILLSFISVSYSMVPDQDQFEMDLRINNKTNNTYDAIAAYNPIQEIKEDISIRKIILKSTKKISWQGNPYSYTTDILIKDREKNKELLLVQIIRSKQNNYSDFRLISIVEGNLNTLDKEGFKFDPFKGKDEYLVQLDLKGVNLQQSKFEIIAVQK